MPLIKSEKPDAVKQNIQELIRSGKPLKQALAISLNITKKSKKNRRSKK